MAELALEGRRLNAGHEQADGLLRILLAEIATADTFEALEEVGAVRSDSGVGIGDLHGHGELCEDFFR